jgi:hypothetical protein
VIFCFKNYRLNKDTVRGEYFMIRSFVATTREIDDTAIAVSEILDKLDISKNLLKNSIGIISCYSEYIETGVLRAICETLPFDTIGTTTCLSSTNGESDQLLFTLLVLTSDDCDFKTVMIPVSEQFEKNINDSLRPLIEYAEDKPKLILTYLPLMNTLGGDKILSTIDKATPDIPLFGTVAVDHNPDYRTSKVIHNGSVYGDALSLGLLYGEVSYQFDVASLNPEKIRKQQAIITESNENVLMKINDKHALDYLEEIGLSRNVIESGLGVLPLVIDHKDGTRPIARAVFGITPEGYVVCGGSMPTNATVSIGRLDVNDVLSTTTETLKSIAKPGQTIISYSCIARFMILCTKCTAEAEILRDSSTDMNYFFSCSGGEICPLPDANSKLKNHFHNFTNVFLILS